MGLNGAVLWGCMVLFGALWGGAMGQAPPYLLVEPQHSSMELYGAIWGSMGLYGALWGCMELYGALWGGAMGQAPPYLLVEP